VVAVAIDGKYNDAAEGKRGEMTGRDQKRLGRALWDIAETLRESMTADDFRDPVRPFPSLRTSSGDEAAL
jgi:hypothetical protein